MVASAKKNWAKFHSVILKTLDLKPFLTIEQ